MRIKFLGAAQTVTGSCYLLETDKNKLLVDCGMFQGSKEEKERNYRDFPIPASSIDFVLLSHAHIDHSGLLPKLIKEGFNGRIITTAATADLCEVMLPDSGHIQEMECERKNRKRRRANRSLIEPIYTAEDGIKALTYFDRVGYDDIISLTPEITVRFLDAGHILGSGMLEVWVKENGQEKKILFSGDIGNKNQPFIKDPSLISHADYILMESTYGNRVHKNMNNRSEMLQKAILDTYQKGGNLVIPAFAVGRTQDVVYEINQLQRSGKIPLLPIYIDSPMAVRATEIFKKYTNLYDQETTEMVSQGNHPLLISNLHFSITAEESQALNEKSGCNIIISASGMCDAGRIKHHLRHNLWRPECTILIVGYQANGTLGRRLVNGEKLVRIHGEEVAVQAEIRTIDGYSAHADQKGLLGWLQSFKNKPEKVFIVHGESDGAETLKGLIEEKLGYEAVIPKFMEEIELTETKENDTSEIQKVYMTVAKKMQQYLAKEKDPKSYDVVMSQLKDMERWLDNAL